MDTQTVNISFPRRILSALDRVARAESRSRSELLRDAALSYLERKQRWSKIFSYWTQAARGVGLAKREDVGRAIGEYRKRKAH